MYPRRPDTARPAYKVPQAWLQDPATRKEEVTLFKDIDQQRRVYDTTGKMKLSEEEVKFVFRYAQFQHQTAMGRQLRGRHHVVEQQPRSLYRDSGSDHPAESPRGTKVKVAEPKSVAAVAAERRRESIAALDAAVVALPQIPAPKQRRYHTATQPFSQTADATRRTSNQH